MRQSDWMPIYSLILEDMGYDRASDEDAVRILKAVTVNSDLVTEDEASVFFKGEATVFGDAPCLESDISAEDVAGTTIASGSSVHRLLDLGIRPDVVVTDLDGDIGSQLEASSGGSLTFIHAHGDNQDLIRGYAWRFEGPVILTTQSVPDTIVADYGGFTDGDRAVCIAQEFGVRRIRLMGFDFDDPNPKKGGDPAMKLRKLQWARRIIGKVSEDIEIVPDVAGLRCRSKKKGRTSARRSCCHAAQAAVAFLRLIPNSSSIATAMISATAAKTANMSG